MNAEPLTDPCIGALLNAIKHRLGFKNFAYRVQVQHRSNLRGSKQRERVSQDGSAKGRGPYAKLNEQDLRTFEETSSAPLHKLWKIQDGLSQLTADEKRPFLPLIEAFEKFVSAEIVTKHIAGAKPGTNAEHLSELERIARNIQKWVSKGSPSPAGSSFIKLTLGVIHALQCAIRNGFQDTVNREYKVPEVAAWLAGDVHVEARGWLAGYYLNDAVIRTAALEARRKDNPAFKDLFSNSNYREVLTECERLLDKPTGISENSRKVLLAQLIVILKEIDARLPRAIALENAAVPPRIRQSKANSR